MNNQIKTTFVEGLKIRTSVGKWDILTDQPVKDGGDDSAPNPFQLFLASLASCAGYYALTFCTSRKISTQGLGLDMFYTWDKKEKRVIRMNFEIELPEDFPEKYQDALVRAVEACTVKKHLAQPPEMKVYFRTG